MKRSFAMTLAAALATASLATGVALTATPVAAAESTGTISGVITDAKTKATVPNALVLLHCTCLEGMRETQTNAEGVYAFRGLPPGTFTVQVLAGQADVTKITTLSRDAKFRANFQIDPEHGFKRAIKVSAPRVPMSASERGYSLQDGLRDMGQASVSGRDVARTPPAHERLAQHRRDSVATREVESDATSPRAGNAASSIDAPAVEVAPASTPLPDNFARQVVYSATMELAVFKLALSKEKVEALVVEAGGYVASLKQDSMVLRIPAKDFRAIVAKIGKLGRVESQEFEALDVTADYYDLQTRIDVLRRTQTQLLALLGEARNVTQALEVRRELDKVMLELERALGQQRFMAAQLQYSVLSLALGERIPSTDAPSTNDPFPWVDEIGVEGTAWR